MAQTSSLLDNLNLVNYGFVVCDEEDSTNSFELVEVPDEVNGAAASTFYIQQGPYIVPVTPTTLVNDANCEQYIVEDADEPLQEEPDQSNQTIIYCTPEEYVEYTHMLNNEEQDENSIDDETSKDDPLLTDETDDATIPDTLETENSNSNESNESMENSANDTQPTYYQFAVLKDGKFFLQTLNINTEQNSYLKQQIEALQASISYNATDVNLNKSKTNPLDFNKITGKNLITGQTVTLEKYMNKLLSNMENSCINKRVVIGKTSNGKRLVGKIVHVEKAGATKKPTENCKPDTATDSTSQITIVNAVNNILECLMSLQKVADLLSSKQLVVTVFKCIDDSGKETFYKSAFCVKGRMENNTDRWKFTAAKVSAYKNYGNVECEGDSRQIEDCLKSAYLVEKTQNLSNDDVVYLTFLLSISKKGNVIAKVSFAPKQSSSESIKKGFEIRIDNQIFGCDQCFKLYDNRMLLSEHKEMHQLLRCYTVCKICNKKFNSAGSLKRHLGVHDSSTRTFQCPVCSQRFTDTHLKKHMLIHTGIRSFTCKMCQRSFNNKSSLNFHNRIHDNVKLFFCDVCGREFTKHSNLVRHAEIHRGDSALFHCHLCGCSYSFPSSLTRHIVHKHLGNFSTNAQT